MQKTAILDQTNPVYNTAKLTLSILGNAGVPEAITYAEKLGFVDYRRDFKVSAEHKSDLPQAILQEGRFVCLNRVIRENGCKNVVDIACGFSPRGYIMAKEGYNYLGIDLEASVEALTNLAKEFDSEQLPGSFRYAACDLTNPAAFEALLDEIPGKVLIICEGLMMYLQPYEAKSVAEGIRAVLKKHGGCFVTGDFTFSDLYVNTHIALLGKEEGMRALMEMGKATAQKSNTVFTQTLVKSNGSPEARKLYESLGLQIDSLPFYTEAEKMYIWEQMDGAAVQRVKGAMGNIPIWRVTAPMEAAAVASEDVPFSVTFTVSGSTLNVALTGRVDSITATEVMTAFQTAKDTQTFDSIVLDMTDMQYISSAGLRVVLFMKKSVPGGEVRCIGMNNTAKEIFETTGFDAVVTME